MFIVTEYAALNIFISLIQIDMQNIYRSTNNNNI